MIRITCSSFIRFRDRERPFSPESWNVYFVLVKRDLITLPWTVNRHVFFLENCEWLLLFLEKVTVNCDLSFQKIIQKEFENKTMCRKLRDWLSFWVPHHSIPIDNLTLFVLVSLNLLFHFAWNVITCDRYPFTTLQIACVQPSCGRENRRRLHTTLASKQ